MHGSPVHSPIRPARARVALRIVVTADTWLERHGLVNCVPATGVAADVSAAENDAHLLRLAQQYAFRTVVLAQAAPVLRLLRSGQWRALHEWRALRWVVAGTEAAHGELMHLLPERHARDVAIVHNPWSMTLELSKLITPGRGLPARQQEVLTLIQQGMSNKQIAASLGVSIGTVKNHVSAVLRKLNVHSRTQAALSRVDSNAAAACVAEPQALSPLAPQPVS